MRLWVPEIHRRWSQARAVRRLVLARRLRKVSDGVITKTIRVDRAAPEIHGVVTALRVNPQVSGPDDFSAPTGSGANGGFNTGGIGFAGGGDGGTGGENNNGGGGGGFGGGGGGCGNGGGGGAGGSTGPAGTIYTTASNGSAVADGSNGSITITCTVPIVYTVPIVATPKFTG